MKLTIFTPTYNRSNLLKQLYQSLVAQTNHDFLWLIIDDGSKDNTTEVVNTFINENKINIKYIKKENGGKYTAMDLAHEICTTEYIAGVDSDDYLLKDAVNNIYSAIEKITDKNCLGIVGRKFDKNLNPLDIGNFEDGKMIKFHELSSKYNYNADTFLIFKTDIVRNFKFPKIEDEKFITEKVLYNQFMFEHPIMMSSNIDYIVEYQTEGYSANSLNLMFNNPKGVLYAFKSDTYYYTKYNVDFARTILAWARFYAWRRLTKLKSLYKDELKISTPKKIFGWILSFAMYFRYKNKQKNFIKNRRNK